jgi:hypothetical protein
MYSTIDHGEYSIKGVQTFKGREGMGGFNLTLYRNGKRVSEVINSDNGGCHSYYWFANKHAEEAALREQAQIAFPQETFEVEDRFIWQLLEDWENNKRFKRICKKEILVRLDGDEKGTYRKVNMSYSANNIAGLRKTFEEKGMPIVEVLNEVVS